MIGLGALLGSFELSFKPDDLGLPNPSIKYVAGGAVLCAVYLLLRILTSQAYKKASGKGSKPVPIAFEGSHPLLGHVTSLSTPTHHKLFDRFAKTLGGVYLLPLPFGDHFFVLSDPEIIAKFLAFGTLEWPKCAKIYEPFNLLCNVHGYPKHGSFFTMTDGPRFRHIRKAIAQCFSIAAMKKRYPSVKEKALAFAAHQEKQARDASLPGKGQYHSVECFHEFAKLTNDVFLKAGFDVDTGVIEGGDDHPWSKFVETLDEMLKTMNMFMFPGTRYLWFLPAVRKFKRDRAFIESMVLPIIKGIETRPPPADDDMSPWAVIRRLTDFDTKGPASLQTKFFESLILIMAGYDTTSTALSWGLYCLARYPEAQDRLSEELAAHGFMGPGAGFPTYDELLKLPYLDALFKETLRLFPTASDGFIKQAACDLEIEGGMVIPEGTPLWIPLYALHRNPKFWPEPEAFKPSRFLDDKDAEYLGSTGGEAAGRPKSETGAAEDSKRHKKFLPFSEGPRSCVGMTLAIAEFKATLVAMAQRFRFEVDPRMGDSKSVEESTVMMLTLKVEGGMWIRCIPRY